MAIHTAIECPYRPSALSVERESIGERQDVVQNGVDDQVRPNQLVNASFPPENKEGNYIKVKFTHYLRSSVVHCLSVCVAKGRIIE